MNGWLLLALLIGLFLGGLVSACVFAALASNKGPGPGHG